MKMSDSGDLTNSGACTSATACMKNIYCYMPKTCASLLFSCFSVIIFILNPMHKHKFSKFLEIYSYFMYEQNYIDFYIRWYTARFFFGFVNNDKKNKDLAYGNSWKLNSPYEQILVIFGCKDFIITWIRLFGMETVFWELLFSLSKDVHSSISS